MLAYGRGRLQFPETLVFQTKTGSVDGILVAESLSKPKWLNSQIVTFDKRVNNTVQ